MIPTRSAALTLVETRNAEIHLIGKDHVMKELISNHGPCQLSKSTFRPFRTLARSIISQQLSAKAADTIEARVRKLIGGQLCPQKFQSTTPDELRLAGLSAAKARYLIELSRRVLTGEINFNSLQKLPDIDVITVLTDLPGVGLWTAEMFLIFGLKRPNVLALGDAGLKRAARLLYGSDDLEMHAKLWHPYCSVASWYLWRHLDT